MRREYKGFYIEKPSGKPKVYTVFHVVTDSYLGAFTSIRDAMDAVSEVHSSAAEYSQYAGCTPNGVVKKRGRYVYNKRVSIVDNNRVIVNAGKVSK